MTFTGARTAYFTASEISKFLDLLIKSLYLISKQENVVEDADLGKSLEKTGLMLNVKEYLAALEDNRLLGLKCKKCGFITAPPRMACRRCGGYDSEVVELSGKGKIATFTSVHVSAEARRGKTPYLVVLVELEEGPWIMGNLLGVDPSTASFDLMDRKVTLVKVPPSPDRKNEDTPSPQFQLAE